MKRERLGEIIEHSFEQGWNERDGRFDAKRLKKDGAYEARKKKLVNSWLMQLLEESDPEF